MPKAKQQRDRHLTFNASHELAEEDRSFLRVVSLGNFAKVRHIFLSCEITLRRNLQLNGNAFI